MLVSSLPARMVELVTVVDPVPFSAYVLHYGMGSSALSVSKFFNCPVLETIGILGQVWYLIASIPDLCTLTYFDYQSCFDCAAWRP